MAGQSHITQQLKALQQDLFDLSARNPLVQVDLQKLWFLSEDADQQNAQNLYRKAQFFEKEYGLQTTLLVSHFIRWQHPQNKEFYTSPLLCRSIKIQQKKRESVSYIIAEDDEPDFVNPILQKLFSDLFDLQFPEDLQSPETLIKWLTSEFSKLNNQTNFSNEKSWSLIEKKAVGIFNYKKIVLARDYEKLMIKPGHTLLHLLGEKMQKEGSTENTILANQLLDPSQKGALQQALKAHTVIQGPPGTGKSETIVALIKTLMLYQKKVLFVSEKRSALEVVFQRLKKEKIDSQVAFFNPDKDEKKQFYAHLKKAWEQASETIKLSVSNAGKTQLHDLFAYYPGGLQKTDPASGMSVYELFEKLLQSKSWKTELTLEGNLPEYTAWQKNFEILLETENRICHEFKADTLAQTSVIMVNASIFNESEPVRKIAKHIDQLEQDLKKISSLVSAYHLDENPETFTKLAITASILTMVNKNQLDLLQKEHKKFKTFNALAKKFQLTQNKLQQAEQVNRRWKKKPTVAEITELTDLLKQKKKSGSILGILKRNSAKSYDYFAGFSEELSTVAKLQLLEEVRTEWHLKGELEAIRIKLRHELDILHPETEIDHILQVRSKLGGVSQNQYLTLLEHVDSETVIQQLAQIHSTLNHASGLIAYLFARRNFNTFAAISRQLQQLKNDLERFQKLEYELKQFFKLPEPVLQLVRNAKGRIAELDLQLTLQQLHNQTRFEPAFKKLNGEELWHDFEIRRSYLKTVGEEQATQIRHYSNTFLANAEKLAETPASKLKPDAKIQKQQFKDAKRILIHEFTKKQQHLPISTLMQQHAETILELQPVWIMNPLSVSQFLPCEEAIFDYVIVDEASQVPLEDAIPAAFRGARLVVVGDSQQMPPGRFFATNPDGKTLLDQAEITCKSIMLRHHYRSEHPDLIAFSNNHFYDFELEILPPVSTKNPIELIHVNGVFEDSKNITEAIELVAYYKALLKAGKTDIGIIAFSKEQQTEIEKQLALLKLPENELLVVRNLENVQGIEKEIILISVGYAKNKEGVFRKNFGPVNQDRGANRLNVLFTRAIRQMVIFTSISSADFELSENRGVTLLANFLKYAEQQKAQHSNPIIQSTAEKIVAEILEKNNCDATYHAAENGITTSCFIQHHSGKIVLVDPGKSMESADQLFSLLNALSKRFAKIRIMLSNELLKDLATCEKELIHFFKK